MKVYIFLAFFAFSFNSLAETRRQVDTYLPMNITYVGVVTISDDEEFGARIFQRGLDGQYSKDGARSQMLRFCKDEPISETDAERIISTLQYAAQASITSKHNIVIADTVVNKAGKVCLKDVRLYME